METIEWLILGSIVAVIAGCVLLAVRSMTDQEKCVARAEMALDQERAAVASALNLLMAHGFEPQDAFAMLAQARRDGLDLDAFARAAVAARRVPG